ncbi:toll-like receptor 2 type-1 [Liolophura sinensis]|uniref:toll-like receptor 2 type-1 n=1 Tax=Liolophura sinensis TaxID=3198878 RepID=UPI0031588C1B
MTTQGSLKRAIPREGIHLQYNMLLCYVEILLAVFLPTLSKPGCDLDVHRLFLDCSSRGWKSVQSRKFSNDTHGIDLSYNRIVKVRNQTFINVPMLEFLDLSNNVIKSLQSAAFQGLSHLVSLNLSYNRLPLSFKVWTPQLLEPLGNLRLIKIKGPPSTAVVPWQGIGAAFGTLTNLTKIFLDLPVNFVFEEGFHSLEKLTTISTHGESKFSNCKIVYLTTRTFRILEHTPVRELRLVNCKILLIQKGTFDVFTSLEILDLSYNIDLGLNNAMWSLHSFRQRNMTEINLAMVNGETFNFQDVVLIPDETRHLSDICVRSVDLSMNSISILVFSESSLWIDCLVKLNVSHHSLQVFPSVILKSLSTSKSLKSLDFSQENVVPTDWRKFSPYRVHKNSRENVSLSPNLSWLSFSKCWSWFGTHTEIHFSFTSNLRHLGVAFNNIGKCKGQCFKGFYNLTSIDMSGNSLTHFPTEVFANNNQLRTINLANNKLQRLPSKDLDDMYRIEILDLSANVFTYLQSDEMTLIDSWLEKSPTFHLLLGNNPLQCTCDTIMFIRWVIQVEDNLDNPDSYTCILSNGTRLPFSTFRKLLTDFEVQCVSHTYLIISVVGVSTLIVLVLLFAGIYRYRLNLRYWLYTKLMPPEDMFVDQVYTYDAFVAYTCDDYEWVIRMLRPKLELVDDPIRLCVHDRDFIPGKPIHENIVDKMKESRKILLIISQGFLESRFGPLEIEYAGMKCLEEGRDDTILCVLMEDIPVRKMPRALRNLWHKITFLKWSDDADQEIIFWRNLKAALTPTQGSEIVRRKHRETAV